MVNKRINSLIIDFPELAKEWNYEKNKGFMPEQATSGMGRKVWWKCEKGHEWEAVIQSRTRGNGCPYCSNAKVLKGYNDLATINPELLSEWDYDCNLLNPNEVLSSTPKKAWWKCSKCGYRWEARINTRSKKEKPTGCPACAGKVVIKGINDLATKYPSLAEEWDSHKNEGISPDMFLPGSAKSVWWKGKCGHEWKTAIANRTKGKGCPFCAQVKTLKGFNDLKTNKPDLLLEWDYEKNSDRPDELSSKSSKSVWWICSRGHSYRMRIAHRVDGHGCPYCAGQKPIVGENDLATTNPDIVSEWHPQKNGVLKPTDVMRYSEKKVWWLGVCGHEWETSVVSRVVGKTGCPICNPTGTSFPEQAIAYYVRKVFPSAISRYKEEGVEFDVFIPELRVGIEYDGVFFHKGKGKLKKDNEKDSFCIKRDISLIRIREDGLPATDSAQIIIREKPYLDKTLESVIADVLKIVAPNYTIEVNIELDYANIRNTYIQITKEKSLAVLFPQLASEWDKEKNNQLTPYDVLPNSNRNVWWKCSKGHSFKSVISNRTKGNPCPYCGGRKAIAGETDLFTVCPELEKEWDYSKNKMFTPERLLPGSGKKAWWICSNCGYSWETQIISRTGKEKCGCPACAGRQVWKGHNDLLTKYPLIAAKWNYEKNKSGPDEFVPGSEVEVWWKCSKNHEYKKKICLQVSSDTCPICSNRRIVGGENDLVSLFPQLMKEWDYVKNENISPEQEGVGSQKKVWWICPNGHSYSAVIRYRTKQKRGCPYCSGRKVVKGVNDLLSLYPELALEWDYEKNELKPDEVSKGRHSPVFWKCKYGHEWTERIPDRIRRNTKCPYCFPRRVLTPGVNDLATTEPLIAAEWDNVKNAPLLPSDVMRGSQKKVWWVCKKGHSYFSSINMRTSQNLGCPYCSGQKVLQGFNDLSTTHPAIALQWDEEKNGSLFPNMVSKGSNKKVWWKCAFSHSWEATVNSRKNDICPICKKLGKVIDVEE